MTDLFIEILQEEIPARMQSNALKDITTKILEKLHLNLYPVKRYESYVSPQRLVFSFFDLDSKQADHFQERKGPRVNAPEQAIKGFLGSLPKGIKLEDCNIKEDKKGKYYIHRQKITGKNTVDILPDILTEALNSYTWAKSMRWQHQDKSWVRPIRNIVALYDSEILDWEFIGVKATNTTYGHRFISPKIITIDSFEDYKEKIAKNFVVIDKEQRKKLIIEQAEKLAKEYNLTLIQDNELLDEISGLCEYPNVLLGSIEKEFMGIPQEILLTSMKVHQRYLGLSSSTGELANKFIVVSNNLSFDDNSRQIILGNERVLKARLSDAKFFWENDLQTSLDTMNLKLTEIVYHNEVGYLNERVESIVKLSNLISADVKGAKSEEAEIAARYLKADLTSEVVYEFPELQGVMGSYYANYANLSSNVSLAIREHYNPKGLDDDVPSAPISIVVALATKIDTLAVFWAINKKPTGSKDPYALRRCAIGIIKIILNNKLKLNLSDYFEGALLELQNQLAKSDNKRHHSLATKLENFENRAKIISLLQEFIKGRLKVVMTKGYAVEHKIVNALLNDYYSFDILNIFELGILINDFLPTDNGIATMGIFNRISGILEKSDFKLEQQKVQIDLINNVYTETLLKDFSSVKNIIEKQIGSNNIPMALNSFAGLFDTVNNFFDNVIVHDDNGIIRKNNCALLYDIFCLMNRVIPFSDLK